MSKDLTIAIIGAGSRVFSEGTIGDILLSEVLARRSIDLRLMDIVPENLVDVAHFAKLAAAELRRDATVSATSDLRRALDGADFVFTALEVERYLYWSQDFLIPRKYGFAQIYGENGGPGGMFHALRNMGPLLEVAQAMEGLCPGAWLINYSNPEAKLVQAVTTLTKVKAVGMCHGVFMGREQVSRLLELPEEELATAACGLNHCAWFQEIRRRGTGKDLYPLLREKELQAHWLAAWDELALSRLLLRTFGRWPYPGANHIGEYLRWSGPLLATANMQYFYDPAAEDPWASREAPAFVYDLAGNPTGTPLFRSQAVKQVYPRAEPRDWRSTGRILPSGEEGVAILEGVVGGAPRAIATVNVPNCGCLPGLPDDTVVELPAVADGEGLHPRQMAALPTGITAMLHLQAAINRLLVEAYVERSRRKLLQAVLLDPTVSSYHQAVAMIDELCERQKEILPTLHW
jgi:alpha-galactosidase